MEAARKPPDMLISRPLDLNGAGASAVAHLGRALNQPAESVWRALIAAFLSRYQQQAEFSLAVCLGVSADADRAGVDVHWGRVTAALGAATTLADLARQLDERQPGVDPLTPPAVTAAPVRWAFRFVPERPLAASYAAAASALGVEVFVEVAADAAGATLLWQVDPRRPDAADLARMQASFQVFLAAAGSAPGRPCSRWPLLSPEDAHQLAVELNRTDRPHPRSATLVTLFEAQAARQPEALAVVCERQRLTYAELNQRANQAAHRLRARGVGPGVVVGLVFERGLDLVIAQWGVLKAGGAYVAFDPQHPHDLLARWCEWLELRHLVTALDQAAAWPPGPAQVMTLEADAGQPDSLDNPAPAAAPDDLALILFTSGSTGLPKGVRHTHRTLAARFHAQAEVIGLTAADRYGQLSPLSSIDAHDELLSPLVGGARVVILPYATVVDPHALIAALRQEAVTQLLVVPSLLKVILTVLESQPAALAALRVAVVGGEPLTAALAGQFHRLVPPARLINFYGLTEGDVAAQTVTPASLNAGPPPIGRPVANTRVYLLDAYLNLVPVGVAGEIHVAGAGLMAGYLNRPDLDAERWVASPFGDAAGPYARLFKTGDLGRYLPSGEIEYLGRRDRMVKIRGFRVELGEVEAALQRHPAVADSVVAARPRAPAAAAPAPLPVRLVGYVVLKPAAAVAPADLRHYLATQVPDYAVPAVVMVLDRLPLSPNGKVDVRALPEPGEDASPPRADYAAPRDALELQLARLWESLLKVRPIGVTDNFFELGGDSLMAVDLVLTIERDFQFNLPISALLAAPTVAALAEVLCDRRGAPPRWQSLVPIQAQGHHPPLFCVHADGGILFYYAFAQKMSRAQPIYGIQARGLLGQTETLAARLEVIAAQYLAEVRSVQAHGPYYFCAFSLGGAFIFEMAQQLRAAGEAVAFVGMLDAYGPEYPRRLPGKTIVDYKLSVHRNTLRLHNFAGQLAYLRKRLRKRGEIIYSHLAGAVYSRLGWPMPQAVRYNYVRSILNRAAEAYHPRPYPGPVTVFRASIQPEGIEPDPSLGWRAYVSGDLTLYATPGTHNSIMKEPHLSSLIAQIEAHLDTVRG